MMHIRILLEKLEKLLLLLTRLLAPTKEVRVKHNIQYEFDEELMHERIRTRDKLFAMLKNSKRQNDNETFKQARNNVKRMMKNEKKISL